ncbi:lytic murein transglycosylase [Stenotrophomonas beteli]|uniref:Lytic murein transglycosylase n=1 Tax=Stenotrophomonas beteli TaxID=3384461 RepID=A0A0R0BB81_9GAMM|nr:lytic murein transglycosylase [Stenotrophomonas maltophilia]
MKPSSIASHVAPRRLSGLLQVVLPMLLLASALPARAAGGAPAAEHVVIQTEDVARFFQVLDASKGRPSAQDLQRHYLDPGSKALHGFTASRIGSMERLARAIQDKPALFEKARSCAGALPAIRTRVAAALVRLGTLLPDARFPPVTVLVGRGNSGGVTTPDGVVIGLEALCNADWMQSDLSDRFVHLIAHEFVHIQQPGAGAEVAQPTLLYQTLLEGGAEYVAELISGQPANAHLRRWTQGRECALERQFALDSAGTDLSQWLYNGPGDETRRGDLGYWIGYRIAAGYVARAPDRRSAMATLLKVRPDSAPALLAASEWRPACGPVENR